DYLVMPRGLYDEGRSKCIPEILQLTEIVLIVDQIQRITINIESCTHWYSLVAQENKNNKKRGLYFLCSNCYAQQTDKNQNGIRSLNPNGKIEESRHKTMEISVITRLLEWFLYLIPA
ncbi:MAG: hypothetical protein WB443_07550, partial [Nitrososphaeraceae archaeon]